MRTEDLKKFMEANKPLIDELENLTLRFSLDSQSMEIQKELYEQFAQISMEAGRHNLQRLDAVCEIFAQIFNQLGDGTLTLSQENYDILNSGMEIIYSVLRQEREPQGVESALNEVEDSLLMILSGESLEMPPALFAEGEEVEMSPAEIEEEDEFPDLEEPTSQVDVASFQYAFFEAHKSLRECIVNLRRSTNDKAAQSVAFKNLQQISELASSLPSPPLELLTASLNTLLNDVLTQNMKIEDELGTVIESAIEEMRLIGIDPIKQELTPVQSSLLESIQHLHDKLASEPQFTFSEIPSPAMPEPEIEPKSKPEPEAAQWDIPDASGLVAEFAPQKESNLFDRKILSLKGFGKNLLEKIKSAGFTTEESLSFATLDKILEIKGMNLKKAQMLMNISDITEPASPSLSDEYMPEQYESVEPRAPEAVSSAKAPRATSEESAFEEEPGTEERDLIFIFAETAKDYLGKIADTLQAISKDHDLSSKRLKRIEINLKNLQSSAKYMEYRSIAEEIEIALQRFESFISAEKKDAKQLLSLVSMQINRIVSLLPFSPDVQEQITDKIGITTHQMSQSEEKPTPVQRPEPQMAIEPALQPKSSERKIVQPDVDVALLMSPTLSIDMERVNALLKATLRLPATHIALQMIGQNLVQFYEEIKATGKLNQDEMATFKSYLDSLEPPITGLSKAAGLMRAGLARLRLVGLKKLFSVLSNAANNYAKQEGLKAIFESSGEEVEMDGAVLEQIGENLIPLLRSMLSLSGTPTDSNNVHITASASYKEDMINVELTLANSRINLEKIKKEISEEKIILETELAELNDSDLTEVLLSVNNDQEEKPGAPSSVKRGISRFRNSIEKRGGYLNFSSPSKGDLKVVLGVPKSLPFLKAHLVTVRKMPYLVPSSFVSEIAKVTRQSISTFDNEEVVLVNERMIPLLQFSGLMSEQNNESSLENSEIFDLGDSSRNDAEAEEVFAIILTVRNREFAMISESVPIVNFCLIEKLDSTLVFTQGMSGTALLGDGSIVPVLDISSILKTENNLQKIKTKLKRSEFIKKLKNH